MTNKPQFARYNDGVVQIYREKGNKSNFGARINPASLADLDFVAKLAFAEMSKRQQDLEFAESMQFSLDLKVKTRYIKGVDNKCKAVIDGFLYGISYIDMTRTEMYIYLEAIDKVERGDDLA